MSSASSQMPSSDLMESLMKDPIKRALVLQLLNQEKDNIENYKRQELKTRTTPLKKVKKLHCESPTALQRRRALEKRNPDTSESSSSEISDIPAELKGPKLPFEQLLKGVRAYVEVKRDNENRSEGIKAVMRLMGATIRDKFTNDVTHVIFKDGSFTTFEKAKLMKVHLVSVLWLDAVRRNNTRVPEKNYPAFGSRVCDENVSILCSQIQKDYEDVIKDERRRRHTMMTPKTSITSYLTAHNLALSDNETSQKQPGTPELTSDDSDCGIVDGHTTKRIRDSDILQSSLAVDTQMTNTAKNSYTNLESSDSASLLSRVTMNKRKTISVISDMVLTPNVQPTHDAKKAQKAVETTPEKAKHTAKVLQNSIFQSSTMSSLRVSPDSDKTRSDLVNSKESSKTRSSLFGGKENCSLKTINSTMSSLRLSESPSKKKSIEKRSSRGSDRTKTTPPSNKELQRTPSNSASSSTKNKVEDTVRKGRKSMAVQSTKSLKKRGRREPVTSESEDENSAEKDEVLKKIENPAKSNTSTPKKLLRRMLDSSDSEFEYEVQSKRTETVKRRVTESGDKQSSHRNETPVKNKRITPVVSTTSIQDKTPKRTKRTSVGKASALEGKATSDENSEAEPKQTDKSKRGRRLTSVTPSSKSGDAESPNKTEGSTRNRRASSVASTASPGNRNLRTSRRSIARTVSESEMKETSNDESEFPKPKTVKKLKRATSVTLSTSEASSIDVRSRSEDRSFPKVRVLMPPVNVKHPPETTSKVRKTVQATPSPPKKSRVEQTPTVRKLYDPNEIAVFSSQEEEDERERKEHQKQKSQKSPDIFLDPNNVRITPLPSQRKANNSNFDPSEWSSDDNESKETKQKTKIGRKKPSPVPQKRDSSADEQRELLELLEQSNNVRKRRSERLCLSQTKPKYTFSSRSDSLASNDLPITPIKRRSTLDFVQLTPSQQKRRLKLDPKRTTSIVCTKLHRDEVLNFESTAADLGRFFVEDKVTGKTSHLVAGEAKRTINMLRAIARGCWILKHEWLLKSQEMGRWLNEEDYELTEFSPAVQQCRLQKEAFGPLYSMDIFKDCGPIYVGKSTNPRTPELKELISICKGKVTTAYRNATISVGELINRDGVTCVTEMWVLESIHFNKLKSFKHYLLQSENPQRSPTF